jgi:hypothetical protein
MPVATSPPASSSRAIASASGRPRRRPLQDAAGDQPAERGRQRRADRAGQERAQRREQHPPLAGAVRELAGQRREDARRDQVAGLQPRAPRLRSVQAALDRRDGRDDAGLLEAERDDRHPQSGQGVAAARTL